MAEAAIDTNFIRTLIAISSLEVDIDNPILPPVRVAVNPVGNGLIVEIA